MNYIVKTFDNELLKLKVKNIIATREAARNNSISNLSYPLKISGWAIPIKNL